MPLSGGAGEVMQQFQNLMNRFLDTQQSMMLSFLGPRRAAAPVAAPLAPPAREPRPAQSTPARPAPIRSEVPAQIVPPPPPVQPQVAVGPPPPSPARVDRERLTRGLLEVVSERTGYPAEMLGLELNMEADLGIDSIKRVEILAGFQRLHLTGHDEASQGLMDRLVQARTMAEIIDLVMESVEARPRITSNAAGSRTEPAGAAVDGSVASSAVESVTEVPRTVLEAVETPVPERTPGALTDRVLLIADDGRGVGQTLAEGLGRYGHRAVLIHHADTAGVSDGLVGDLRDPAAVKVLLDRVRTEHGPLGGVIHLLPLRERPVFADLDLTGWRRELALDVESLFLLTRTALADLRAGHGSVVLGATALGGDFGPDDGPAQAHPSQGAVGGFVKTLAIEWPSVRCKVVDSMPGAQAFEVAENLLAELLAADRSVVVTYRGAHRLVPQPRLAPLGGRRAAGPVMGADWVILVTGGARGITAEVACDLAVRYRPTLILTGRSPLPTDTESPDTAGLESRELKAALIRALTRDGQRPTPSHVEAAYTRLLQDRAIRQNLARMRDAGATVRYEAVDVRNQEAFGRLLDRLYLEHGRVDGVIHGAGIIEDRLVEQKSLDSFQRVLHTKTDGAFVLLRHLKPEGTRLLVFFASVAGTTGNRGQADYAAANEVLNKLATVLDRTWPGRVVALNWGPWKSGMVSSEVERQFVERGVTIIPPTAGCQALLQEIQRGRKGESEVILAGVAGWSAAQGATESAGDAPVSPASSPLLAGAVRRSGQGGRVEVELPLDPARHHYLVDHVIDGKPVLPMAVAMELMAEVVQQSWRDWRVLSLRSVRMLQGVILENGARDLRVVARPQAQTAGDEGLAVDVEIVGRDAGRPNYRGTVLLGHQLALGAADRLPDVPPLAPFTVSPAEAYRRWLFHGPTFQRITAFEGVGGQWLVVTIQPSTPTECVAEAEGQWIIDPILIDCAFQTAVISHRFSHDMTTLPARLSEYRRLAVLSGAPIRCYVRVEATNGGMQVRGDFYFAEPDGRLVAVIEGLEGMASRGLNRLGAGAPAEGR